MKSTADIVAYLHSTKPPWIAVLPSKDWLDANYPISGNELLFIEVKGSRCQTKSSLLRHFAERLRFPHHFGQNWDAFEDCIRDLEWLSARGYVIVIVEADQLLRRSKKDLRTFVDIMNSAGEDWASSNRNAGNERKPFHTVLLFRPDHRGTKLFRQRPSVRTSD